MRVNVLNRLKLFLKNNYALFKLVRLPGSLLGYYKSKAYAPLDVFWQNRIDLVLQSPDNVLINRVAQAGSIDGDTQIMHNGIRINVGSYYGDGNTVLLHKNKGVHEPQEERAFQEILTSLPEDAIMLELGAFWAFYSITFLKYIKEGKSYLVEPDKHALVSGKNNFRLNGRKGSFHNYYISEACEAGEVPTITVTEFCKQQKIIQLHILHSDIQGFELKMLHGAKDLLLDGKISYLFISTHSNELHQHCKDFLREHNYDILCEADLNQTYSWDGLIVAKHQSETHGPTRLSISHRL